jgi:hypothetical protein
VRIFEIAIKVMVQYGMKLGSQTVREKHGMRVFESRVITRIFRPKRDEMIGDWRKVSSEEIYNF